MENLLTPPFLDQPSLSAFYALSIEIFETSPFSQFWESPTPPLGRGVLAMENRSISVLHHIGPAPH